MRALRYDRFGPVETVARWIDVEAPAPAPGQVRVRVRFASINPLDWKLVEGHFRWFLKSRPPCGVGVEFSGIVDALGAGVDSLAIGTPVLGVIDPSRRPPGTLQQYVVMGASDLLPVPAGIGLDAAATLPVAGLSALQMCRLAGVAAGQRVLVHGAAGGVGSYAVQIVRTLGALPVATGSAASQASIAALQPHAQVDYATSVATWPGPFDALLDCATTLTPAAIGLLLPRGGHYVSTLPRLPGLLVDPLLNALRRLRRRTVRHTLRLAPDADGLRTLLQWLLDGRLRAPIGARFASDAAVEALQRYRGGRTRGKMVVEFDGALP